MDIILSKNERMEKIEKKIRALELRMEKNFEHTNEVFETFRKVIVDVQKENKELKKDRDFLLEKYKDVLRKFDVPEPVKETISETAGLIRDIASEGFNIENNAKNIDDLFEIVINSRKIALASAAKKLKVDEKKALYWALALQKKGLIAINNKMGRTELCKI